MLRWLEFAFGLLVWLAVIWDGFATIVLPRTVAPMRRLSGRFNRWSWRLWASVGRRIERRDLRLSFLAVYGPISVISLLIIWAGLMIVAFALIYHGLGPRLQAASGSIDFGTLLYMSGSTFLTLGLGDITSADPVGRFFIILETGDGLHLPGADHHLHALAGPGLRGARGRQPADPLAGRPPARSDQAPAPLLRRPTAWSSSAATSARPNAGWPRRSRPTSPIPCSPSIGRSTGANPGWSP